MHMMMKLSELSSYQKKPLLFTNLNSDTKHESQNVLHFIFKSPPFPLFLCRFDYLSEVKHVGEFPQESLSNENLNVDLMENDSALKFELSAAGLWKLHSHPLGSSDSDRRTTSTTLKKRTKKAPRKGKCNTFFQYLSIGKVEINFVILDEFELDEKTHLSFCCIFHRKPGKLILPRK